MFGEKERRDFRRLGFLTIRDGVDADLIEEAREVIENDDLPETQAELEAVTEAHEAGEPVDLDVEGRGVKLKPDSRSILADAPTEEPFRTINEQVYEYAEALVGEGQLEPPDAHARIPLRFPYDGDATDVAAPQPGDMRGHIDGSLDAVDPSIVTIGAGIYLDDVGPRGGGFTVWPGSHRLLGKYIATHTIADGDGGAPAPTADGTWDEDRSITDALDPFEVVGEAGTVTMWHGHIHHSAGYNLDPDRVRKAMFSRFPLREDLWDITEIAPDPFYGWTALEDVDVE